MPGILFRYVASSYIMPLLASTVFFICFLMSFRLMAIAEVIFGGQLPLSTVLLLVFDLMLTFMPLAVPLSIVFSSIYCFHKLSGDSEYVAMRSIGLSKSRALLPIFLVTLLMSINLFVLSYQVIPLAQKNFRSLVEYVKSTGLISQLKSGQFFTKIPRVTFFAEEVNDNGSDIKKLFLHLSAESNGDEVIIFSNRGKLVNIKEKGEINGKWRLVLYEGNMVTLNEEKKKSENVFFKEFDMPVPVGGGEQDSTVRASNMTGEELKKMINLSPEERKKIGLEDEQYLKAFYEYHNMFNNIFVCLVFCVLGFTIGAQVNRRASSKTTGLVLFLLIAYYALYFFGISMANKGNIPSWLGVYGAVIILAAFTARMYRRMEWSG